VALTFGRRFGREENGGGGEKYAAQHLRRVKVNEERPSVGGVDVDATIFAEMEEASRPDETTLDLSSPAAARDGAPAFSLSDFVRHYFDAPSPGRRQDAVQRGRGRRRALPLSLASAVRPLGAPCAVEFPVVRQYFDAMHTALSLPIAVASGDYYTRLPSPPCP